MSAQATKGNAWWPSVSTVEDARKAAHQGMYAAFFVGGVTTIIAALVASGTMTFPVQVSFIDGAIFLILGFGILRLWRSAAVIGLVLYIAETLYKWSSGGAPKGAILSVVITFAFITSVRGTFAYHALQTTAAKTPSQLTAIRPVPVVQPASPSTHWLVIAAVALVILGVAGYFGFLIKFDKEAKGTAQLNNLPPAKGLLNDTAPPMPVQAAAVPARSAPAVSTENQQKAAASAEAQRGQETAARRAAEPQIYLEPQWKMYHVPGCPAVTPQMQRVAIEQRPINYVPHSCVPEELRTWKRMLRQ